ncbi:hypothetical protein J437_LFUL012516 [Ladona fulva]|uniref:Uncharacterized protein n=1 Tax=Ladona fulva TaxID=123851 RepID=A0A8K0K179_LADFU|nr:hypothetical protein J437_LFUL012516 [Ladona fulva]
MNVEESLRCAVLVELESEEEEECLILLLRDIRRRDTHGRLNIDKIREEEVKLLFRFEKKDLE